MNSEPANEGGADGVVLQREVCVLDDFLALVKDLSLDK